MNSGDFIQNKNRNLRGAVPVAAIATAAIGGAATQPAKSERRSSKPEPQVRTIASFNWLSRVNWAEEVKDLVAFTALKPHTPPKIRHLTLAQQAARLVSPSQRVKWERVHNCENYWTYNSSITRSDSTAYAGGLDIEEANWVANGGLKFAENAALATPDEQILEARDIQYSYSFSIPRAEWIKYGGLKYAKSFSNATGDERRAIEENIDPHIPDQVVGAPCESY